MGASPGHHQKLEETNWDKINHAIISTSIEIKYKV